MKELRHGDCWGDWTLEAEGDDVPHLVLTREGGRKRAINLNEITDSAKMLDWIFQFRMKGWATNDIMGDLLSAFRDIYKPQQTLCSEGKDKHLDAKVFIGKRLAR
ncbi:MAG: hypothetical protein WBQ76_00700 [Candidatus Korobacteraceae bacterium]